MAKRSEATRYLSDNMSTVRCVRSAMTPGSRLPGMASGRLLAPWFGSFWGGTVKSSNDIWPTCPTRSWAGVDRKALAFEAEIARLRSEVYPCEAACEALLDAGLALS